MMRRKLDWSDTKGLLFLSFFLPFIILTVIYIYMGNYPFGNGTVLTVDLGQQYIDFYNYFRHTLLEEPKALLYSFAKGIGGEMTGLWAYYLNSPFNLLLLLFPQRLLPVGAMLLILLKLSSAGLAFAWLLLKQFGGNGLKVPAFALSYSLMGYAIVNQLNIMWLDGLVFLPLIIYGLEDLLEGRPGWLYSGMLGLMIFSNYYIGYMLCLFLVLYFFFFLAKQEGKAGWSWGKNLVYFGRQGARFGLYSLLGAGLAGFSLLPNLYSLLMGKASYVNETIDWSLAYPFPEILSKFYLGSFNFDQMPSGHPNLFIGTVGSVCALHFFFNRQISRKERLVSLFILIVLFLSMNVNYLNKVWHGFQYPIWYPYRFSFVVSFFLLLIGFRSLQRMQSFPLSFAVFLLLLQVGSAIYVLDKSFDFVLPLQVLATVLLLITVLVLFMMREKGSPWVPYVLLGLVAVEMTANATIDLTRLSYVQMKSFQDYQFVLNDLLEEFRPGENTFYRIEKDFQRSKNDSFQANYPSASHFSSTFERETPRLFGDLGFPDGNGFISYSSGTLFTDALFAIKYYGQDNELPAVIQNNSELYHIRSNSTRPDLSYYPIVAETLRTTLRENPYALPLAFGAAGEVADIHFLHDQPVRNQEALLRALSASEGDASFFIEQPIGASVLENLSSSGSDLNQTYTKVNPDEEARLEIQFTADTNDPYYLILDSSIKEEQAELELNGRPLEYYKTYRNDQVLNVASNQAGELIRFSFLLEEDSLEVRDLKLYRFNTEAFASVVEKLQEEGLGITSFQQTQITGDVTIAAGSSLLFTTIPYSEGWQAFIDGEPADTVQVLDSLLGVPISPGQHTVTFRYRPPYLWAGIGLSTLSLGLLLLLRYFPKGRHQRSFWQ